jgi:hypothetical protein
MGLNRHIHKERQNQIKVVWYDDDDDYDDIFVVIVVITY